MNDTPTPCVATLVASKAALTEAAVARARAMLAGAGAARWLEPNGAADIPFLSPSPASEHRRVADRLRAAVRKAGVAADVIVQPEIHRRKKLFLADMDSTMIGQECVDELADFVGLRAEVSMITERAMRGEIAFEPALRERVALLRNLPVSAIDEIIRNRITLTAGGRALVHTMRANGAYTCLVSGGFTLFTGPIAARIGFDEHRSNVLIVEGERLAGRVEEPILGRSAKLAALVELRTRLGLEREETLAVGDGANDLAMLAEAGLGVAFHAKPAVAAAAHARIEHADLRALLHAQGFRTSEFVEA